MPYFKYDQSTGPLPRGTYTLGQARNFKNMKYSYDPIPDSGNKMCGRSAFLIHGGGCSGNPSEGCIVIESEAIRSNLIAGATLHVVK